MKNKAIVSRDEDYRTIDYFITPSKLREMFYGLVDRIKSDKKFEEFATKHLKDMLNNTHTSIYQDEENLKNCEKFVKKLEMPTDFTERFISETNDKITEDDFYGEYKNLKKKFVLSNEIQNSFGNKEFYGNENRRKRFYSSEDGDFEDIGRINETNPFVNIRKVSRRVKRKSATFLLFPGVEGGCSASIVNQYLQFYYKLFTILEKRGIYLNIYFINNVRKHRYKFNTICKIKESSDRIGTCQLDGIFGVEYFRMLVFNHRYLMGLLYKNSCGDFLGGMGITYYKEDFGKGKLYDSVFGESPIYSEALNEFYDRVHNKDYLDNLLKKELKKFGEK